VKTASADKSMIYRDVFAAGQAVEPAWARYSEQRRRALTRVLENGLVTSGREDWVHGEAGGLATGDMVPVHGIATAQKMDKITTLSDSHLLVFVNGVYEPTLSRPGTLPAGVVVQPLSAVGELPALGSVALAEGDGFTALNMVFWRDGLYLDLPDGVVLEQPIELQFRVAPGSRGGVVPVRNFVRLGAGSRATIVERFTSGDDGVVAQPVTEIVCGPDAVLNHIKIIDGEAQGEHFGSTHVVQRRNSRYNSWEMLTGWRLSRRELHVDLAESGAVCDLNAIYMGGARQRFDLRTRVDHNAAGCTTRELYKGVLNGEARGVFDGLIRVAADSQQTVAHQTNRNLLLSDDAVVNSIPRLEIYADDVKCSHGSTTGQLSDEQLFYLRTRGFSPAEARAYLAGAFASEVIETMPVAALREELFALVSRDLESFVSRLNQGDS